MNPGGEERKRGEDAWWAPACCPHLNVQGGDVAFQVLLGLRLLISLVLEAVPLIFQLTQLGGHIEFLPGFFL